MNTETHDLFIGTIGFGAYFAPRFRGDITLDFRGKQGFDANATYSYTATPGGVPNGNTINGVVRETFRTTATVAMVNGYFDILPRGAFSPYVGAGIGFAYYDIDRGRYNRETEVTALGVPTGNSQTSNATSKDTTWGLAAALMAGVSFSFDHRWAIDVGYRAQYLDEASLSMNTSGGLSKATFGDTGSTRPASASAGTSGSCCHPGIRASEYPGSREFDGLRICGTSGPRNCVAKRALVRLFRYFPNLD